MNNLVLFGEGSSAGQQAVASALESGLSADAFWGAIQPFVPLIIVTTLVALGYFIVRKIIKKFSKGKAL